MRVTAKDHQISGKLAIIHENQLNGWKTGYKAISFYLHQIT